MTMDLTIIVVRKNVHALDLIVAQILQNVNVVVKSVRILIPIKSYDYYSIFLVNKGQLR